MADSVPSASNRHPGVVLRDAIREAFGKRFRRTITNTPDGVPTWLDQISLGNDPGLFAPTEAPWIVHGDLATLIGGIRALLVQALHPATLAGVAQHSRYESDPLGRLAGTTRWLTIATFGSKEALAQESRRVNGMHRQVQGSFINRDGQKNHYDARNRELLLWVHIAFTESFLTTHREFGRTSIPGGSDAYVRLWAKSVEPLGLSESPRSHAELLQAMKDFQQQGSLSVSEDTASVVRFIRRPPLAPLARLMYRLLFQAAVSTLSEDFQTLLGLRVRFPKTVQGATRALLWLMRLLLGPTSPIEQAALERRARLGLDVESELLEK